VKREQWVVLALIGLAVIAAGATGVVSYAMSRGLRNNNPGNIKRDGTQWQGMSPTQSDPTFVQFTDPLWGIRAMARVLTNYMNRGLRSVSDIIGTWAPPSENDTEAYVAAVANSMGVDPNAALGTANLPGLVSAIIEHENGTQPYSQGTIVQAVALA
jgi:hypothetical protein